MEVDRRTLRRYIAMLEEMGIPITTEQGRYGGYRLVPGYKLPPMMFTDEEAQALSLGLIAARGLGLADAAPAIESVQAKLDRVLPSAPKRTLAALRESVALQTGGARANADAKLLRVLSETAQARRTAALRYRAAEGALTSRDFDVYGLVFRAGRWYVVGHCHLRSGLRTLRLDRVAHAEPTARAFVRPEGFDPSDYLARAMATPAARHSGRGAAAHRPRDRHARALRHPGPARGLRGGRAAQGLGRRPRVVCARADAPAVRVRRAQARGVARGGGQARRAARRALPLKRYQTRQRFAPTIGCPGLHAKACWNSGRFTISPFTRYFAGECGIG